MQWSVEKTSTLLEQLQETYPQSSTTKLRKMLTEARVEVNNEVVFKAKFEVQVGDTITILNRPSASIQTPPPKKLQYRPNISILFEDETLLVVDKPHSLLSVATNKLETDTLHSRCVEYLQKTSKNSWCHIVHRLDKDTSGVMVFAKDEETKNDLQEQFARREVHRIYSALVEGTPSKSTDTIHTYLIEDKHLNMRATNASDPRGKEAITHFTVVQSDDGFALVEVMIETGRRHQIRMAMQYIGTPVCGDSKHGSTINPFSRICLHATSLEFVHPDTDDPVRFESPYPTEWNLL
jgi:23S rRNA pseudouridine1911/1915/1917 synthase